MCSRKERAMRVILFGATGMVGQGVLRECLLDPDVNAILTVGRSATGTTDAKVRELVLPNMFDYSGVERELAGYDACFFCLGVSSAGMKEPDYERVTYALTMAAAQTLVRMNPQMTFVYVSGQGTDSSEKGRTMWARVKGKTENALLRLPFKSAYMFRPGFIQPLHGIRSKTALYQAIYSLTGPVIPLLRRLFPKVILTTEEIGKAMLAVAKRGAPLKVLEVRDIQALLPVG
jgi:uncharacterized protein YbjT (DUF2867 family)